jgi:acetylornithine deacetylase/succinyl-diaminopimelate desuccinylase-like protein
MAQERGSPIVASSNGSEPVELLRDLLRVRSINPPGDEAGVAELLETYHAAAGLETKIVTSPGGRLSLIARLDGPQDRPALVLLSHSDVVPVEENNWTRDPFGGEVADGFIWGRGALDMKGVAVMHAVAVAELARSGHTPSREVIVALTADEEAGGGDGARWVLDEHPELVGFGEARPAPEVISEGAYGLAGMLDRPIIPISTGEKTAVFFDVVAQGDPGHGALPPQRQAVVNLAMLIERIAGFGTPRIHPVLREQFSTLTEAASGASAAIFRALASPLGGRVARAMAPKLRKAGAFGLLLSDSTTPTRLSAGYKSNVVPAEARASFDARLLPDTAVDEYISSVDTKARRLGGRVDNVDNKGFGPVSGKGPLFEILTQASEELAPGAVATAALSPGITDLRFFRARGATGYGWIPLVLTPELLATIHGHDERVGIDDFEQAITVMFEVVLRSAT